TPRASDRLAPRRARTHATETARFSYRINIPDPTRTAPAIDWELRKIVCCLAISASSGLSSCLYLFVERGMTKSTRTEYFFKYWLRADVGFSFSRQDSGRIVAKHETGGAR